MLAPTTPIQLNRRGTCTIVISWFYRNSNTASAWIEASQCFIRNLEKIRIDERKGWGKLDTCRYGNQIDVTFIQRIIIIILQILITTSILIQLHTLTEDTTVLYLLCLVY